eukprot:gene16150-biopygen10141
MTAGACGYTFRGARRRSRRRGSGSGAAGAGARSRTVKVWQPAYWVVGVLGVLGGDPIRGPSLGQVLGDPRLVSQYAMPWRSGQRKGSPAAQRPAPRPGSRASSGFDFDARAEGDSKHLQSSCILPFFFIFFLFLPSSSFFFLFRHLALGQ